MSVLNTLPLGDKASFAKSAFGGMDVFDLIGDLAKLGQDKNEIEDILGLLDVNLNDKRITSALGNIGKQTLSLTGIFKNFGETLSNAFTGLGTLISNNLPIIAIIAAISAAVKITDALILTSAEATDAMIESFGDFENAQNEVEALNSELEETKSKIAELEAKGHLSFVEQEELNKLKQSQKELETQSKIAQQLADIKAKSAAADTIVAFKTGYKHDISQEATDNYKPGLWDTYLSDESNVSAMIAGLKQWRTQQEKVTDPQMWNDLNGKINEATA